MSLKDIEIKRSYETGPQENELINDFYLPILENSIKYYRIAGFFSSSSLCIALRGVEAIVSNGGKIKLLISPELSDDDYNILKQSEFTNTNILYKNFDLNDINENDHLRLFAWLLANDRLEIKIVVNKNIQHSLFHQKIGIMMDNENNMVSFSGSINETAQAWLNNIEEFKTFKSWVDGQSEYLHDDLKKFVEFWNNDRSDYAIVYDIPTALKDEIIRRKPKDINELSIMRRFVERRNSNELKLSLFPHQLRAVEAWKNNNRSILMEMATGTGKTRTALGCMTELLKENKSFLTIIATPQGTLSRQWKIDVEELKINVDFQMIIDGSNNKWVTELEKIILDFSLGMYSTGIIYTTHATASDSKFIKVINSSSNLNVLFICDEVHGIGSEKQRNALLPIYNYRIGLSATPERMFDDDGTNLIRKYFGNKSFEFTIAEALNTINPITGKPFLNRYLYKPVFVDLTENEMDKYKKFSQLIMYVKNQEEYDEKELNTLYTRRANILKNAESKIDAYKDIINELQETGRIIDTITFVTDKQINVVMEFLAHFGIVREKITEEESATKKVNNEGLTERQNIIKNFKDGICQILLGLKCLDEGIDIPNARIAILLASSTNPREYIQRVGRVIRQSPDKDISIIYDIIVAPNDGSEGSRQILEKEGRRANVIAQNAVNYDVVKMMFEMRGVDLDVNK